MYVTLVIPAAELPKVLKVLQGQPVVTVQKQPKRPRGRPPKAK